MSGTTETYIVTVDWDATDPVLTTQAKSALKHVVESFSSLSMEKDEGNLSSIDGDDLWHGFHGFVADGLDIYDNPEEFTRAMLTYLKSKGCVRIKE